MKSKFLQRLPEYFDIGWAKFYFIVKKNLASEGQPCYGLTDFNEYKIFLEETMEDDVAHATIIHEVFHVLLENFGLGGEDKNKQLKEEHKIDDCLVITNEYLTERCSRSVIMFRRLNPELWKLLFEDNEIL